MRSRGARATFVTTAVQWRSGVLWRRTQLSRFDVELQHTDDILSPHNPIYWQFVAATRTIVERNHRWQHFLFIICVFNNNLPDLVLASNSFSSDVNFIKCLWTWRKRCCILVFGTSLWHQPHHGLKTWQHTLRPRLSASQCERWWWIGPLMSFGAITNRTLILCYETEAVWPSCPGVPSVSAVWS